MATAKKTEEVISIRPVEKRIVNIRIVGDSPLIVHNWTKKAKQQMLDAQTKKTKTKAKEAKDPFYDFADSLHWICGRPDELNPDTFEEAIKNGAKWGFPADAIKKAGNSAAYRMGWVKNQMALRASYFITSEYGDLAEIKGSIPQMREDMVRVGMGTADIRYRPVFESWYMDLQLEYNANSNVTLEQILNIIEAGGYGVGIGEWRPEKDGRFGTYHIERM